MLSAAGADRVVSVDLHSGQIQGFFDTPFDHLVAAPVLEAYMREHFGDDVVVVAPDAGRVKVAERYSQHLGLRPGPGPQDAGPGAPTTRSRPATWSVRSRAATAS